MAFVQATSNANSTTNTTLVAPNSGSITTTVGNMGVLADQISPSGNAFTSFSTSNGDAIANVNTVRTTGTGSLNVGTIAAFVGGAMTFTYIASGPNSNYMYGGAAEFSGRAGTATVSTPFTTIGTFVQTHAGAMVTGVPAGADIIAVICDVQNGGTETFTATGGWTLMTGSVQNGAAGNYVPCAMMYMQNVAGGTYQATWSTSLFVQDASYIIVLPAAGAGANLAASQGSYGYTGSSIGFRFVSSPPNLLAASGTYNLSLAPASSDFQALVAAGAYSYVGLAASLVPVVSPVTLIAQTGFYSIAAQNAILTPYAIPTGGFPNLVGQYYWEATLVMEQIGALVPSKIGYFGTSPITIKWVTSKSVPGTVVTQSVAPGTLNFVPNSPITFTVSEFPIAVSSAPNVGYPTGGAVSPTPPSAPYIYVGPNNPLITGTGGQKIIT